MICWIFSYVTSEETPGEVYIRIGQNFTEKFYGILV